MDSGTCRAHITFYYYDSIQKKCVQFNYGGCEGNANRFDLLEDCQETCENKS